MYEQKEYLLAYLLVFAFLALGFLIVCIPRPRKKEIIDKETAAKLKRQKQAQKAKSKKQKLNDKKKKKRSKAAAKRKKQNAS